MLHYLGGWVRPGRCGQRDEEIRTLTSYRPRPHSSSTRVPFQCKPRRTEYTIARLFGNAGYGRVAYVDNRGSAHQPESGHIVRFVRFPYRLRFKLGDSDCTMADRAAYLRQCSAWADSMLPHWNLSHDRVKRVQSEAEKLRNQQRPHYLHELPRRGGDHPWEHACGWCVRNIRWHSCRGSGLYLRGPNGSSLGYR